MSGMQEEEEEDGPRYTLLGEDHTHFPPPGKPMGARLVEEAFRDLSGTRKVHFLSPQTSVVTYYPGEIVDGPLDEHFKKSLSTKSESRRPRRVPPSFYDKNYRAMPPPSAPPLRRTSLPATWATPSSSSRAQTTPLSPSFKFPGMSGRSESMKASSWAPGYPAPLSSLVASGQSASPCAGPSSPLMPSLSSSRTPRFPVPQYPGHSMGDWGAAYPPHSAALLNPPSYTGFLPPAPTGMEAAGSVVQNQDAFITSNWTSFM